VLRRRELTDLVAVVTRYFGGIKLGAGGLVRAYSLAVSEALDGAVLMDRRQLRGVEVRVAHADAGRFDNLLRAWAPGHGAVLDEPVYESRAVFRLWVPQVEARALAEEVAAASAGAIDVETLGVERLIDVPRP